MRIKYYIQEMRPLHWVKNLLVLFPLICSGQLFQINKLFCGLLGFISFCFLSSAIYVLNDIKDIEYDRNNPQKNSRPVSLGKISKRNAIIFAVTLLFVSILINIILNVLFKPFWFSVLLLLLYVVINIAYSFGLKDIPLLDIAIIVTGFLIRAVYGAIITEIHISNWLYLFIVFAAFFIGFGKRRNELKSVGQERTRPSVKSYPYAFLDRNMYVCMTLVIVFYALWTMDSNTISAYHTDGIVWTVPLVLLIFLKYSFSIESTYDKDPVEIFFKDKILVSLTTIYMVIMLLILYIF